MRAVACVVIVSCLLLSASARAAPKFLGWRADGTVWFAQKEGAPANAFQICRTDGNDVPNGWPEGLTIGPGAACADLPEKVGETKAGDYVKRELKGAKSDKKHPFGLELKVETGKDGKLALVALDGPDKKSTLAQPENKGADGKDVALKIADAQWRVDGKAVAVVLVPDKAKEPSSVAVHDVSALLLGGPAGSKLAARLVGQAQGLMKKRDWSGAGRLFEEAITADAAHAPARYGRAAAEAQGGVGRTAMIENLTWLKDNSAKDKDAKRLLDGAKNDAAFDAWVGEPEVRELLGLPKASTMDVPARLLERKAIWSVQGSTCKGPWFTLAFKGGKPVKGLISGAVTLTVADSCKGKKSQKTAAGVWGQTATGTFEIEFKKLPEGVTFPGRAVLQLDESYQQLKLAPTSGDAVGPFEPGVARIDDSTL